MKTKQLEPRQGPDNVSPTRRVKEQHTKYDDNGSEIMDPTPISPPIGYKKSPTIAEQMRLMIRGERLREEAEAAGYETFEEADDFDVGDDFDPRSPYEEVFEPLPVPTEEDRFERLGSIIGNTIMTQLGGAPDAATGASGEGPSGQPAAPGTPQAPPAPSSPSTPDNNPLKPKPRAT